MQNSRPSAPESYLSGEAYEPPIDRDSSGEVDSARFNEIYGLYASDLVEDEKQSLLSHRSLLAAISRLCASSVYSRFELA